MRIFLSCLILVFLFACATPKPSASVKREAGPATLASACKEIAEARHAASTICPAIFSRFFQTETPLQNLRVESLGAPAFPSDGKTIFLAVADPRKVAHLAYCYFEFRGWFDPKAVSPEAIALSASGFAILKEELGGYSEWLKGKSGEECVRRVRAYAAEGAADLNEVLREATGLIAVNPIAAIQEKRGITEIEQDALLTVNHERIHVLQVLCPKVEKLAQREWKRLPRAKRAELKIKYPAYDWAKPLVAVRENFALKYESRPLELLAKARGCQIR